MEHRRNTRASSLVRPTCKEWRGGGGAGGGLVESNAIG